MASPTNIDEFIDAIQTQDPQKRVKVGDELAAYLSCPSNNTQGADRLVDGLVPWCGSSNFKICLQGLELLGLVALRCEAGFQRSVTGVLPAVVDRLGDAKQQVRDEAREVLFKFMSPGSSPQYIFDLLPNFINHKNWRVREEISNCLQITLNNFGARSVQTSKLLPHIIKLMADPNSQVRDAAASALVEVYRHVGERVRVDLSKQNLPDGKLNSIFARFDDVQKSGTMVAFGQADGQDEEDNNVQEKKKVKNIGIRRSASFAAGEKRKPVAVMDKAQSAASASGAVDEADFISSWDEVADPKIFSSKEIPSEFEKINSCLSDGNNDWEKRCDALRQLRCLAKIKDQVENFTKIVKDLEIALRTSVKDLRSQVVREACVSLSYLSRQMQNEFDYMAEALFPTLINLIPNTVKIMASSGHAAIRLIIKNTCAPRVIPIIISNLLTSKSKEIRRRCAEYIDLVLEVWDTGYLKNHVALLEEAIRKGVGDADSECRAAVRRAFWHFADHYQSRADNLMQTFDSSKQKLLMTDKNLLQTGAGQTQPKYGAVSAKPVRSASTSSSKNEFKKPAPVKDPPPPPPVMPARSASQLDYKSIKGPKMTPRQKSCDDFKRNKVQPVPAKESRGRSNPRPNTSQPSSRNVSPKRAMPPFTRERSEDFMKISSPMKTRIPTPAKPTSRSTSQSGSRQSSRDPSPIRSQMPGQYEMRYRNGTPTDTCVTEDALLDALKRSDVRSRKNSSSAKERTGSDESDGSSINSERSKDSAAMNKRNITQDLQEILTLLQGVDTNARRDGLVSFQSYLHGNCSLRSEEVNIFKEAFNKYFPEANSKLYSLFLDVLSEFIVQHKNDLQDWLWVLLTRLLFRLATDMLPSTQSKIARVLDVVRDSYPYDHQFQIIAKFVTDNTQTPNLKMKVALLQYLRGLIALMDPSDFQNLAAVRLAVSRIITWISEPKSAEIRTEASLVILALFELNTPEFSMMLANLPNSIQEGATRVLQGHLKLPGPRAQTVTTPTYVDGDTTPVAPSSAKKDTPNKFGFRTTPHPNRVHQPLSSGATEYASREEFSYSPVRYDDQASPRAPYRPETDEGADSSDSPTSLSKIPVRHKLQVSGDLDDSPAIAPPVFIAKNLESVSSPFGYGSRFNSSDSPALLWNERQPPYNSMQYEESLIGKDKTLISPEMHRVADGAEEPELRENMINSVEVINQVTDVLGAGSIGSSSEEFKNALLAFIRLVRTQHKQFVGPKLSSLVPVVLKLLKHKESTIRCLAARALREISATQPDSYRSDLKGFLVPLLEAESDVQKEVAKTAEECSVLLGKTMSPSEVIPVVAPLVADASYPTNLSAIKLLNAIAEECDKNTMKMHIDLVVTSLLKAYDHDESSVRKAAVFCLVAVHNLVGPETVTPYFKDLAGSKMKLLNLYIRRSQSSSV